MKRKIIQKTANLLLSALGLLLFVSTESAMDAAKNALNLCAISVIPSLFPFMVLSGLIVRRNLLSPLYPIFPTQSLFRLPAPSACAILLGALCGFPIGAKTTAELYRTGQLTKNEAERTIAIANNCGPAFAVNFVGRFFEKGFGLYLYTAQLVSAAAVGVLFCRGQKEDIPSKSIHRTPFNSSESPIRDFAASLTDAASAVIPLCGYIVFFSILCAILRPLVPWEEAAAFLCTVFEITSGIRAAAALGGPFVLFLVGFSVGFSGISVFVQSYCFTSAVGLSLRRAFLIKAVQGSICGVLCCLFSLFF